MDLADYRRIKELDPDKEASLWQEYRHGNDRGNAHRELVEFYLPLVVQIVERLSIRILRQVEKEELVSVGVIGLHHAIGGFSKDRGVSFVNYANRRIKGSILDELRKLDHLSRGQRREYRDICAMIRTYTEEHGQPPDDDQLAELAGMSIDTVRYIIGLAGTALSLNDNAPTGNPYSDIIPDRRSPLPSDQADRNFSKEAMRMAFRQLPTRDQQLMFLRHHEGMRVKEISAVLGITEGRVSQIYKEIIVKLRAILNID